MFNLNSENFFRILKLNFCNNISLSLWKFQTKIHSYYL